jgi:diguanylate cyclase (GGDEF)-like protein
MAEKTPEQVLVQDSRGTARRLSEVALSLQCKGVVIIIVLALTLCATVAGYLLDTSVKVARRHQDEDIIQMAAMLSKAAAPDYGDTRVETLQELAQKAANAAPLLYVVFLDTAGNWLASAEHGSSRILAELTQKPWSRSPVLGAPVLLTTPPGNPPVLDIMYPINAMESRNAAGKQIELVGYVRTGVTANAWYRSMHSQLDFLIGVGVIVAVVAIPLGFLLIRRIVSPLENLVGCMLRFSQGELDIRSPIGRRDEIGRLAAAFNRMADKHQQTHNRILRLNSRLEERVAERTQQLRELAAREPLTGLYNRRHFNEMLNQRFSEAFRYDTDLSCVMIDLDNFKKVNDRFGHHLGDDVLLAATETIKGELRSADVAARFGGDEFVLLLPQTDAERARVLTERIIDRFQTLVSQRFPLLDVGMSAGIASLHGGAVRNADSLIRAADRALYKAKASGKRGIAVSPEFSSLSHA